MKHLALCMWLSAVVLGAAACKKGNGNADERRKTAAHQEDEIRRAGVAVSVTVRGDNADVMVFTYATMRDGTNLCSNELIEIMATATDTADLIRLGFKRIECEVSGQVFGADLPYAPKVKTPEQERANKLEDRRRSMKFFEKNLRKNGGTDTIDVRGDDGSVVVFGSTECSESYLKTVLATMTDLAERGYTRVECTGPHGTFGLGTQPTGVK